MLLSLTPKKGKACEYFLCIVTINFNIEHKVLFKHLAMESSRFATTPLMAAWAFEFVTSACKIKSFLYINVKRLRETKDKHLFSGALAVAMNSIGEL